ncbi:MAG: diacylglycerol kinase [Phyllobacterium sp.]
MERIWRAFINSMRAFRHLAGSEKAFQQELILFLVSIPVAWFLAPTAVAFLLLTGTLLFLMIVEVLNTGIEAACNALSREFHKDIQIAKDCGSLAVLFSVVIVAVIWGYFLWLRFAA